MLIFLSPAIMDAIVFLVLFAVTYGAGERGMEIRQIAWLGGIFQLAYMSSSVGVGLALSRKNARGFLLFSVVLGMVSAMASLVLKGFYPLLGALTVFGVAMAFFFNAFQTFMRGEAPPGGLGYATALYTASWSGGASLGFLMSGSLYKLGFLPLVLLVLVVSALIYFLLVRHEARPDHVPSADEHVEETPDHTPGLHAAYVGVAWVMIFTAVFVQRPLQTFVPAFGGRAGVSAALVCAPLFIHMLLQAVAGGMMWKMKRWLYRPGILATFQLVAAGLLLLMWRIPSYGLAAAGIGLLGLWAGFIFFCAVFYAANAGNRSRNVGINECLVGLGAFAGLFVSQWFMSWTGNDQNMYAVCGGALALSVGVQLVLARGGLRRKAEG